MAHYPDKHARELIKAISLLENEKEIEQFLRDLLTPAEIQEFSNRFYIARLLWTTNLPYLDIAAKVKTSTTTVTRVAQWLFKEKQQGYRKVLERMLGSVKRNQA